MGKKTRKNPLLKQIGKSQHQESEGLNMTSTFQILTNSILLMSHKTTSGKEEKSETAADYRRKTPKARDNSSADLWVSGQSSEMIVFGGGMHKVGFNDIIKIDLNAIRKNYQGEEEV